MKALGEAVGGDQRAAGARRPRASVSRMIARGQRRGALARLGVERREQERAPEPLVERPRQDIASATVAAGGRAAASQRARDIRVKRVPGARRPRSNSHQGRRPVVGAQAPALAGREIGEIERGGGRAPQSVAARRSAPR